MKFSEIKTESQLREFMTTPSEALVESLSRLDGPVLVLGGSGKMGGELVALISRGDALSGRKRTIYVASTFSDPSARVLKDLNELGVACLIGDLSDENFLASLPDVPNVVFMMGFKFGSSGNWEKSLHLNSIVPYLVGHKYSNSKIVVFSSGNPYPHTSATGKGCRENCQLEPKGIYGWSIVARESSFKITALKNPAQKICLFRLMYAQHLAYGVLVDLARMILQEEPISLAMPAVNLVSQRDANEVALRSFECCSNNPWVLNVAGPVWPVKQVVSRMENYLEKKAKTMDDEGNMALLANDGLCITTFGAYRDDAEEMIRAASWWVKSGGKYWNKPTHFGKVAHDY